MACNCLYMQPILDLSDNGHLGIAVGCICGHYYLADGGHPSLVPPEKGSEGAEERALDPCTFATRRV